GGKATGVPTLLDLLADDEAGRKALSKALDWLGAPAGATGAAPLLDAAPSLNGALSERGAVEFALSDLGNAERFVHTYGDGFRFAHELEKWLHYTGRVWA